MLMCAVALRLSRPIFVQALLMTRHQRMTRTVSFTRFVTHRPARKIFVLAVDGMIASRKPFEQSSRVLEIFSGKIEL